MSAYVSSDNLNDFGDFYEAYITGFDQDTRKGREAGMDLFLETFRGTDIGNMLDGINYEKLDSYIAQAVSEVVLPKGTSIPAREFYKVVNKNSGAIIRKVDQLITAGQDIEDYDDDDLAQFGGGYVKVPLKSFIAFMRAYDGKGNELRVTPLFMETFGDTLMGRVINNEYRPEGLHEDVITEYFLQAVNEVVLPEGTRIQVEDFKQKVNTKKDAIITRMEQLLATAQQQQARIDAERLKARLLQVEKFDPKNPYDSEGGEYFGGKRRRRSKRASRKNRRKTKKTYTSKRKSKRKSKRRSKRRR